MILCFSLSTESLMAFHACYDMLLACYDVLLASLVKALFGCVQLQGCLFFHMFVLLFAIM